MWFNFSYTYCNTKCLQLYVKRISPSCDNNYQCSTKIKLFFISGPTDGHNSSYCDDDTVDLNRSNVDFNRANVDLNRSNIDFNRTNVELNRANADFNLSKGDLNRAKVPKKLGLPKVLPDLPSVSQLLARRKAANSSRLDFFLTDNQSRFYYLTNLSCRR